MLTNEGDLAFSTTKVPRKLSNDRHGVRQLGLAATELSEYLTDAHRRKAAKIFSEIHCKKVEHSPSENSIELLASGRDLEYPFALLAKVMCGLEATA